MIYSTGDDLEVEKISIGLRLQEERKRLGHKSRGDLLNKIPMSLNTLARYETGERMPDALFLRQAIKAGLDVHYILTGARQETVAEIDSGLLREAVELVTEECAKRAIQLDAENFAIVVTHFYEEWQDHGKGQPTARDISRVFKLVA